MRIYKTLRPAALFQPLALAAAVLGACPPAWSQTRGGQGPASGVQAQGQIFKGRGDARRRESEKEKATAPKAPPKITAAQIASYLKGFKLPPTPGSTYVTLSVQTPSVANKGYLTFAQTHLVNAGENYGNWGLQQQVQGEWQTAGYLFVSLKSEAAGRRYLFDCSVHAPGIPSEPFLLSGPDGLEQTFAAVIPGGQHLLFVLETIDAGWYQFAVRRKRAWYAYSCEVTNL